MNNFSISLTLALVFISASAFSAEAQATRTWVSGVGDDVNPCSRTAPCKTFAGAISKTAANGVINCIDSGGFGFFTITKSITVDCKEVSTGILATTSVNGVVINGAGINVTLRGLQITGNTTGQNGIRVANAGKVFIENTVIDGFISHGILVESPASAASKLFVDNCSILNNAGPGIGVMSAGKTEAWVSGTRIVGNSQGILAGTNATIWLNASSVTQNVNGLSAQKGGRIISFKNNSIGGNGTDGAPTESVILQ